MPTIDVVFFQEADGSAPVREWLAQLHRSDALAHARCAARIRRLADLGHELRRPEAGYLREGLHELRAKKGHVNYRILYVFLGQGTAVLVHALTKKDVVLETDIQRALHRKRLVEGNPVRHTHED